MTPTPSVLGNVLVGAAFAGALAYSASDLHAYCSAGVYCSSGPLAGYTISCTCEGSGTCYNPSGTSAKCICDGFGETVCECNGGAGCS